MRHHTRGCLRQGARARPSRALAAGVGPGSLRAVQFAWKFGIVMLIALLVVILPGGGEALDVFLTLIMILFLTAIAVAVYRLFRQYRMELDTLSPNLRLVLYGSVGLALLTFVATDRLFDAGGLGVLAWFALLGSASYGLYLTWTRYRAYD